MAEFLRGSVVAGSVFEALRDPAEFGITTVEVRA